MGPTPIVADENRAACGLEPELLHPGRAYRHLKLVPGVDLAFGFGPGQDAGDGDDVISVGSGVERDDRGNLGGRCGGGNTSRRDEDGDKQEWNAKMPKPTTRHEGVTSLAARAGARLSSAPRPAYLP